MHYVPWNDAERADLEKKICDAEAQVKSRSRHLEGLRERLGRGKPVLDCDFTFTYPEPHCYHCTSSGLGFCKRHHTYGVVCEDYKHWHEELESKKERGHNGCTKSRKRGTRTALSA